MLVLENRPATSSRIRAEVEAKAASVGIKSGACYEYHGVSVLPFGAKICTSRVKGEILSRRAGYGGHIIFMLIFTSHVPPFSPFRLGDSLKQ